MPSRRQFDDAADKGTVDPRADPSLAREGGVIRRDCGDLRLGKFHRHLAALDFVESAEQAGIAAVRHQHLEHEAVDGLAVDRSRDQRQLHNVGADVGGFAGRQVDHVGNKRGAIVGRARLQRRRHQGARSVFRRRALAQNVGDVFGRQIGMNAVAAEQKAVVQRHRLGGVIEPQFGFDAERAIEDVRSAAAARLAQMIGGQEREPIVAQPIGARVADMNNVGDAAAQDQRGEGAAHASELAVALGERIDPVVQRIEHGRRRAAHFHGFGQVAKAIKEAAHRGFGSHPSASGAADAVGDRGDDIAARLRPVHSRTRRRRNPHCARRGPVSEEKPTVALTGDKSRSAMLGYPPRPSSGTAPQPAGGEWRNLECLVGPRQSLLRLRARPPRQRSSLQW